MILSYLTNQNQQYWEDQMAKRMGLIETLGRGLGIGNGGTPSWVKPYGKQRMESDTINMINKLQKRKTF